MGVRIDQRTSGTDPFYRKIEEESISSGSSHQSSSRSHQNSGISSSSGSNSRRTTDSNQRGGIYGDDVLNINLDPFVQNPINGLGQPKQSSSSRNQLPTESSVSPYFSIEQEDLPAAEKAYNQLEQAQSPRNFSEVQEDDDDEETLEKAIRMSLNEQ